MNKLNETEEKAEQKLVKPKATLSEITLVNGEKLKFSDDDKIILVGSNNSGKSQFLRDLLHIFHNGKQRNEQTNNPCYKRFKARETL